MKTRLKDNTKIDLFHKYTDKLGKDETVKFDYRGPNLNNLFESEDNIESKKQIELTKDEIKNMFPIRKSDDAKILVEWNDVCQFTALGAIDLICYYHDIENLLPTNYDVYLKRKEEYNNGKDFVYAYFEEKISREEIDFVYKYKFWDIVKLSPITSVLAALLETCSFAKSIMFYFEEEDENLNDIVTGYDELFNNLNKCEFIYSCKSEVSMDTILDYYKPNVIFALNIGPWIQRVWDKDIDGVQFMCPEYHNQLPENFKLAYFGGLEGKILPHKSSLRYYREEMCVNE